jgi:predicted metal-binding membrane protein
VIPASPALKRAATLGPASFGLGSLLLGLAAAAWLFLVRSSGSMEMAMPGWPASAGQAAEFTLAWGIMMTAMMLPSAAPTVLLYRTVSRRLAASGERAVPAWAFAGVYLLIWTVLGIPVYAGYVGTALLRNRWASFDRAAPFAVALVLVGAGIYQWTGLKQACLRHCESPLGFLMRRWRSGYGATARLAASHALYCVGCCWALMIVLVVAGAMSLRAVAAITLVVLAEKLLPRGNRAPRIVALGLILLGVMVAARPDLAAVMSGHPPPPAGQPPVQMEMQGQ